MTNETKNIRDLLIKAHADRDWAGVKHYMKILFIYAMSEE